MIYNELMSDFEMDEKDFAADSWSLAVDSSFLQQHKKEVMKQQDVIYGEQDLPETSLPSPGPGSALPLPAPSPETLPCYSTAPRDSTHIPSLRSVPTLYSGRVPCLTPR